MLDPDPAEVPPHDPVYHSHPAPVPSDPPLTVKVEDCPSQIVDGDALAEVGSVDTELTLIVMLWQVVLLQVPSART